MPKGKRKRSRKQGILSKVINVGLIALTFSRVLQLFVAFGFNGAIPHIIREATFGLAAPGGLGKFDLNAGLTMYAPAGAALALGKLKGYAMRHFPVR